MTKRHFPQDAQKTDQPARRPVFRLVQITDLHHFSDHRSTIRGANPHDSLAQVLRFAQPFLDRADAIILTGDLAHDEHEVTYKSIRHLMRPLDKPIWSIPGNHDNPMEMSHLLSQNHFSYLGQHRCANWEVVCLDSHYPGTAAGQLGESELYRLQRLLNDSDAQHVLLVLHHHVLPVGSRWLDSVMLRDADELLKIIDAEPRIKGVCFGHVHQCFEKELGGTLFLSTPSTGTQFKPTCADYELDTRPPGFRWINLYDDGKMHTQTVWLNQPPWTRS